jgi:riboflavin synthase
MFTGIVEGTGTVVALTRSGSGDGARLEVDAPWPPGELAVGDSVAVDGCCLTVVARTPGGFAADLVAETLRRTALGRLATGARVNLERPLALGGRLGGHLVQGHVDGVGRVLERRMAGPEGSGRGGPGDPPEGSGEPRRGAPENRGVPRSVGAQGGAPVEQGEEVRVELPEDLARYVVEKGSIAVDGVSLTVAATGPDWFAVALVPHTLAATTLGERRVGDPVHLEVDVVAKYVERLVQPWTAQGAAR